MKHYSFNKSNLSIDTTGQTEHGIDYDRITSNPALAADIALATFNAWQRRTSPPPPDAIPLNATLKDEYRGASQANVYDLKFRNSQEETMGRFIIREYIENGATDQRDRELQYAQSVARPGTNRISFAVLEHPQIPPNVIIYHHVGTGYKDLDAVLIDAFEKRDSNAISSLSKSLKTWSAEVAKAYEEWNDVTVEKLIVHLERVAEELPPDVVIDMRQQEILERESRHILLPHSGIPSPPEGHRAPEIDSEELLKELANGEPAETGWRTIKATILPTATSRYSIVSKIRLRAGGVELWLLLHERSSHLLSSTEEYLVELTLNTSSQEIRLSSDILETIGIPRTALRTGKEIRTLIEDIDRNVYRNRRHRDTHCGNVLSTDIDQKLIDLGDVSYDLRAVDLARLEISILYRFSEYLGVSQEQISNALAIAAGESHTTGAGGDEFLEVNLAKILASLREGTRRGIGNSIPLTEEEITTACFFQVLFFYRYIIENALKCPPGHSGFGAAAAYWFNKIDALHGDITRQKYMSSKGTASSAICGEHKPHARLRDLWTRALSEDSELTFGGVTVLESLEETQKNEFLNFELTDLQQKLYEWKDLERGDVDAFSSRRHVLILAPTSSGKSTVAEMFLVRPIILNRKRRCSLYVAPTRALAQAKYRELRDRFSDSDIADGLALSTGENTQDDGRIVNANFSIACMVYEKANALFSRNRRTLNELGCVVIDELHMLSDLQRGPILELAVLKVLDERYLADQDHQADALRVIAISTEDWDSSSVLDFISHHDIDLNTTVPPIRLKSDLRPVEVEHYLVLPGATRSKFLETEVVRFRKSQDRFLTGERLVAVQQNLAMHLSQIRKTRKSKDKRIDKRIPDTMRDRLFSLLEMRMSEYRSDGYRALIFMRSKGELERCAEELRKKRLGGHDDLAAEVHSEILRKCQSSSQWDTPHRVQLCAERGIFLHHSEVDPTVREVIETYNESMPMSGKAELIFATETLSYGVNLAVTDVFLFGFEFWSSDRRNKTSPVPLSPCAFHNMAGRAGRLGKSSGSTPRFYVIVPDDPCRPETDIVNPYYRRRPEGVSVFFHTADKAAFARGGRRRRRHAGGKFSAENLTQPFIRSIMDSVRHLSSIRTGVGQGGGATSDEMLDFLDGTLYAYQSDRQNAESSHSEPEKQGTPIAEQKMYEDAIHTILDDFSRSPLQLFEPMQQAGEKRYVITAIGEAIVDTGTEVATVRPLLDIVFRAHQWWSATYPSLRFPSKLYLLCLIAQKELYRQCIQSVPEVSDSPYLRVDEDAATANRVEVRERFQNTLERLDICESDAVADGLIGILEASTWLGNDTENFGKYDLALIDAVLRLFTAIVEWIEGGPRSKVRSLMLESSVQPESVGRLSGFIAFKDQVSWKLIFLVSMLASEGISAGRRLSSSDQRFLYDLANRVRIGCLADAADLIYERDRQKLTREEANQLVSSGITASRLMQAEDVPDGALVDPIRMLRLHRMICQRAISDFENLRRLWTAVQSPEAPRVALRELWERLGDNLEAGIDIFRSVDEVRWDINAELITMSSWLNIQQGERASQGDDLLADSASIVGDTSDQGGALWLVQQSNVSGGKKIHLYGAHFSCRGECCSLGNRWTALDRACEYLFDVDNVMIVPFPWWPNFEDLPRSTSDVVKARREAGKSTLFISPAALMVLIASLMRGFLDIDDFWSAISRADGHEALQVVTVSKVQDWILAGRKAATFIPALRESLLTHFEIV